MWRSSEVSQRQRYVLETDPKAYAQGTQNFIRKLHFSSSFCGMNILWVTGFYAE